YTEDYNMKFIGYSFFMALFIIYFIYIFFILIKRPSVAPPPPPPATGRFGTQTGRTQFTHSPTHPANQPTGRTTTFLGQGTNLPFASATNRQFTGDIIHGSGHLAGQ